MIKHLQATLLLVFLFSLCASAQNTVGLISYNANKAYDGYNLIFPHNQANVYLLDNCGEIVHTWEGDPQTRPGNVAYLLDDGRLVRTHRPVSIASDRIWAGGGGATVEIVDWDNNIEWSYTLNDSLERLHHDIAVINKNDRMTILMIAWEIRDLDEVIAAGRDTSVLSAGELWPDFLREIDPETDEIVWEWYAWDHLVQDFDSTKNNFGVIADNPGKLDINLDLNGAGNADWMHSNAVDYDPINDNIILSVPYFSEAYIIDHTTTTEQAATSFGGRSNKGGDFMFRWGNPANYDQGTAEDQTLFFQHDVAFIDDFVDFFDPNFGKISVFNNMAGPDFSTANIVRADLDMYSWEYPIVDGAYLPEAPELTITHPVDPTEIYSTGLSSFQYLRNGNYLITAGRTGYSVEITPDNEIVWEYITPLRGGTPVMQGDTTLTINNNLTFRMFRYPVDYSAFDGRDLSPKGFIESEPDLDFCDELTDIRDLQAEYGLNIYPNPASDMITVEWEVGKYVNIEIYDFMGRPMINSMQLSGGRKYFDTSQWTTGIYTLRVNMKEAGRFMIVN
jgi:hypothetical protein